MANSNKHKKNMKPGAVRKASPLQNTYREWLTLVPRKEREALGAALQSTQVEDYTQFSGFCQRILADILSGKVDPSVADAARGWAELMFTSIAAKNAVTGNPGHAFLDIITALNQSAEAIPQIEPVYLSMEKEKDKVLNES